MKNRIIIDFYVDDDLNVKEIEMLKEDLQFFVETYDLSYYPLNVSVKFQDEYCLKQEEKKI